MDREGAASRRSREPEDLYRTEKSLALQAKQSYVITVDLKTEIPDLGQGPGFFAFKGIF